MDGDGKRAGVRIVRAPLGSHSASVDAKGRLKLPSTFTQYLKRLREKQVFVTTLDLKVARIYPTAIWDENEQVLAQAGDMAGYATHVKTIANHWGGDSKVDGQGRLLIPQNLRQHLGIADQPVWLDCHLGVIHLYSQTVYDNRLRLAMENLDDKLLALSKKGLK